MLDLGAKSLTAIFWGGGGAVVRIALQLATQIALARILGPAQFGLFAIGAIVISFSNFFSDIGIAYGLIQKQQVNDEDIRFVFTWQIIIGSTVTLAVAFFSPAIADFFGDVNAQEIVFALAIVCLLNALAAPSINILKRNLNFKSMQIAQLSGYTGGYILVGLPLALLGTQAWALVIAWILQATIMLVILYSATRHRLQPLFWHTDSRSLSKYGATVLVTNITNWMIGNIDRVIIARVFSAKEVGLYATSYNILQSPTSALLGVIQPVFFSASARVSDDRDRIAGMYCALISAIALFVLPLFACAAALSETLVLAVYGSKWEEAATVFRPLALAMPLFLVWGMTTPLLWTGGSPISEFKAQFPIAILWIAVSWMASRYSMTAVGWGVCAMFAVRCVVVIHIASRNYQLSASRLWVAIQGGLLVSAICAVSVVVFDRLLMPIMPAHALGRLALMALAGTALYSVLLFTTRNMMPVELAHVLLRLADRCPATIARVLRTLAVKKGSNVNP